MGFRNVQLRQRLFAAYVFPESFSIDTIRDLSGHNRHLSKVGSSAMVLDTNNVGTGPTSSSTTYWSSTDADWNTMADDADFSFCLVCSAASRVNTNGAAFTFYGTDDFNVYPFDTAATDGLRIFWRNTNTAMFDAVAVPEVNRHSHVCGFTTEGSASHKLYINGELEAEDTSTRSSNGFTGVSFMAWADSTGQNWGTTDEGVINALYFWDRPLSPSEHLTLGIDWLAPVRMVRREEAPLTPPTPPAFAAHAMLGTLAGGSHSLHEGLVR